MTKDEVFRWLYSQLLATRVFSARKICAARARKDAMQIARECFFLLPREQQIAIAVRFHALGRKWPEV